MQKRAVSVLAAIATLALVLYAAGCGGNAEESPLSETSPAATSTAPATATTSALPTQTPTTSTPATSPATISSTTASIVTITWTPPSGPVTLTVDEAANRATYKSGTADISGYFYKPPGNGPFPAVVVLHGRAGLAASQRDYAVWLAQQGYIAFAPDYFTPIGMPAATWAGTDYGKYQDRIRTDLGVAVEALKSLPAVAASCIGVAGFSLGGYFAFWLGTRDDVRAVVSYYGAYAPTVVATYGIKDIVAQMKSAVLMFHGDKDEMVPIEQANAVYEMVKSAPVPWSRYTVYTGATHGFGPQYTTGPNATANTDSQQQVIEFLKAQLR